MRSGRSTTELHPRMMMAFPYTCVLGTAFRELWDMDNFESFFNFSILMVSNALCEITAREKTLNIHHFSTQLATLTESIELTETREAGQG